MTKFIVECSSYGKGSRLLRLSITVFAMYDMNFVKSKENSRCFILCPCAKIQKIAILYVDIGSPYIPMYIFLVIYRPDIVMPYLTGHHRLRYFYN